MRDGGSILVVGIWVFGIALGIAISMVLHTISSTNQEDEIADLISTRTEQHLIIGRLTGQVEAYKDAFDYTVRMEQLGLIEEPRK